MNLEEERVLKQPGARLAGAAFFRGCVLSILALISLSISASEGVLHSYAIIQEDGALLVSGRRVHLYGIFLPETSRYCRRNILPVRCGSRAVLALQFKVQGFVHCYPQTENRDGSVNAICYVGRSRFDDGVDLGAYLIERGWAMARPEAPFEYHALERIARHRGMGVWGLSVDRILEE